MPSPVHSRPFVIDGQSVVSETTRIALDIQRHRRPEEEAAGHVSPQQCQRIGAFAAMSRLGSSELGANAFMLAVIKMAGEHMKSSGHTHYSTLRKNAAELLRPLIRNTPIGAHELDGLISEAFPANDPGALN